MRKIFVYGTLKKGYGLNHILKNSKYIGKEKIYGYNLYDSGYGYPLAMKTIAPDFVEGELYEVNDQVWKTICNIEIGAGYDIKTIKDVNFFIYNPRENTYRKLNHVGSKWS